MQLISFFSVCVTAVLVSFALILLTLSCFLLLECLVALLPVARPVPRFYPRSQQVAVLIPAHNEEIGLDQTLMDVLPQLKDSDRLVVVADNCTDATALIARRRGATVIERENLLEVGKGYALDYGLSYLAADPPDVVILIDADCRVEPGAIHQLTQMAISRARPVQATYLLEKPAFSTPKEGFAIFGFMLKNLVRPLGLSRLQLPCLLMGTGMAFPWQAIRSVNLANGHLVEDMKLSLDLTIAGYPPVYCPQARVTGYLPQQDKAVRSQRTRWEHGHLQAILDYVPQLLKVTLQKRRPEPLALALELSVPPFSLLVMLMLSSTLVTLGWGLLAGSWLAAGLSTTALLLLAIAFLSAWANYGAEALPFSQLMRMPLYLLWKLPFYFKFLVKRQSTWVRTERDGVAPAQKPVASVVDKVS
jgi:cellulose synthase/poly-beta-1,6-N-acetylglucosamine synthase-like glycosyltransferase